MRAPHSPRRTKKGESGEERWSRPWRNAAAKAKPGCNSPAPAASPARTSGTVRGVGRARGPRKADKGGMASAATEHDVDGYGPSRQKSQGRATAAHMAIAAPGKLPP